MQLRKNIFAIAMVAVLGLFRGCGKDTPQVAPAGPSGLEGIEWQGRS